MVNYVLRRLLQAALTIFAMSIFCYYLMTLMPGDPIDLMISSNPHATSEDVARLRALYGLDKPFYERYGNWIGNILTGDLGYSRTYRIPVADIIGPRLLNTFILSMVSLTIALIFAIPLGVLSALKSHSWFDYTMGFVAFAGLSVPVFFLGILLILAFSVALPLLPAGGTYTIGLEDSPFWIRWADRLTYMALPALSLSFMQMGKFVRFTRSAMMESMRNDYIRTARAKGLGWTQVVIHHGFRNALLPLITIVAINFSFAFSGAVITETVFAYQGVGKLVYDSIMANDFNVAMVSFVISVTMVLTMTLVADILYGVADPRISYS